MLALPAAAAHNSAASSSSSSSFPHSDRSSSLFHWNSRNSIRISRRLEKEDDATTKLKKNPKTPERSHRRTTKNASDMKWRPSSHAVRWVSHGVRWSSHGVRCYNAGEHFAKTTANMRDVTTTTRCSSLERRYRTTRRTNLVVNQNNDNDNGKPSSSSSSSSTPPANSIQSSSRALTDDNAASILEELHNPNGWTFVRRYPPSPCDSDSSSNGKKGNSRKNNNNSNNPRIGAIDVWKRGHAPSKPNTEADHAPFAVKASGIIPAPASTVAALLLSRDYNVICRFNPTIETGRDLEWWQDGGGRCTHVLTKPQFLLPPRDFVCWVQWWDDDDDNDNEDANDPGQNQNQSKWGKRTTRGRNRKRRPLLSPGSKLIVNTPTQHPQAPAPYTATAAATAETHNNRHQKKQKNSITYCRGQLRGWHLLEPIEAVDATTAAVADHHYCRYTCVHEIDPGGWAPRRLVNLFALRKPVVYMRQLAQLAWETHQREREQEQSKGHER